MTEYTARGATVSSDGYYRYLLWREWRLYPDEPVDYTPKTCLFVMLNPSTADGKADDPTIRRCVGFAKSFGCERLEVVNLFAYRATKPQDLFARAALGIDIAGWENQKYVEDAAFDADIIICAWGAHGAFIGQDETMCGWLECAGKTLYAIGLTKGGRPKHPLYLPKEASLIPWRKRREKAK
ncbi:MAG: DUF1643 domain-containing protein [Alphaproteobacteria bacterium]